LKNLCSFLLLVIIAVLNFTPLNAFGSSTDLLKDINNQKSDLFIEIGTDKTENVAFEGEEIYFYLAAHKDCDLILLRLTTAGELQVIFPNKSHGGYKISGGEKYKVPGFGMEKIIIEPPGGFERIKAIATKREGFFHTLIKCSEGEDFTIISSPETFLKTLKASLELLSPDEWVTADLEISVEENISAGPTVYPTPVVNQELQSLFDNDYTTEFYMQGSHYYEEGNYDDAIKMFKKVIETSPGLAFGYYSLGLSYQAKGAFSEAIEYYKKCLDQGINERDCYIRVGEIYDQMGNKKEAYLRYKKALRETEGFENINEIVPSDTGRERIYELEIKCRDNPEDKKSRMELAVIYETEGNFKGGNYHLKMLLSRAVILYEPYNPEEDKPEIVKPLSQEDPPVEDYYYDPYGAYTYYEPYPEPYTPPPPPPAEESPAFIFVED